MNEMKLPWLQSRTNSMGKGGRDEMKEVDRFRIRRQPVFFPDVSTLLPDNRHLFTGKDCRDTSNRNTNVSGLITLQIINHAIGVLINVN